HREGQHTAGRNGLEKAARSAPRRCSARGYSRGGGRAGQPVGRPFTIRMSAAPTSRPRVHQVLATLGYGDAIGHEVLGIQRVLRRAGYESDIFVETADPRLEAYTIDYRDLVGAVHPSDLLIHHFSIGSRASRT